MTNTGSIADAVANPSAKPELVWVVVRGTDDFGAWMERVLDLIDVSERMVEFSSVVLAEGPRRKDKMQTTVMTLIVAPVRFNGILKSVVRIVIQCVMALRLPVVFKHQGSLLYDVDVVSEEVEEYNPTTEYVLWIVGHGVPSIEEWAEGLGHSLDPRQEVGVVRATYLRGPDRPDGTNTILVARVFRKDVLKRNLEEWKDLEVLPFLGNNEALRSGLVIPPFEPNMKGEVGYQYRWKDDKDYFETPGAAAADQPKQGVSEGVKEFLWHERNEDERNEDESGHETPGEKTGEK